MLIFIVKWMSVAFCAKMSTYAPVAQLDRALACGAKGRRFESCRVYHENPQFLIVGFRGIGTKN